MENIFGNNMSCCCEAPPQCANCCTVTDNFWMFIYGILAALGFLALIFIFNSGLVLSLVSQLGATYTFAINDAVGFGVDILKNGVLVGTALFNTLAERDEFFNARNTGTFGFWLLLGGSIALTVILAFWISRSPNQFVCCKLRPQMEDMKNELDKRNAMNPDDQGQAMGAAGKVDLPPAPAQAGPVVVKAPVQPVAAAPAPQPQVVQAPAAAVAPKPGV